MRLRTPDAVTEAKANAHLHHLWFSTFKYAHHKAQAGIQSVQDLQKDVYPGCFSRERLLDGLENALESVMSNFHMEGYL